MGVKREIMDINFATERLNISVSKSTRLLTDIDDSIINILSPEVTKALPNGWQNIDNKAKADFWLKEREAESIVLFIENIADNKIIGFVFLYEIEADNSMIDFRFGYLLSKEYWGKGLGTELIKAMVNKFKLAGNINSISGGVEKDNIGSIKVLERTGFIRIDEEVISSDIVFYEYKF